MYLVSLVQFQKKSNAGFFDKSRFSCFTNASSLLLFGFFCFTIVLCLENSIVLDELVEDILKKQLEVILRRPTFCFSVNKLLIETGRLILPCFKSCRLTPILKFQVKKNCWVMMNSLRTSHPIWLLVRSIHYQAQFLCCIKNQN